MTPTVSHAVAQATQQIPDALKTAFAYHGDNVDTPAQLAAIASLDVETVQACLADPISSAALVAHRVKLDAQGDLRPIRVGRALDKAVARIEAQLDGGVDGFEAADLAKPLIRILENADRVRLAEREQGANANLPTFNIIFSCSGVTAAQVYPTALVVDVAAKEERT